jgi:hypothetical protein
LALSGVQKSQCINPHSEPIPYNTLDFDSVPALAMNVSPSLRHVHHPAVVCKTRRSRRENLQITDSDTGAAAVQLTQARRCCANGSQVQYHIMHQVTSKTNRIILHLRFIRITATCIRSCSSHSLLLLSKSAARRHHDGHSALLLERCSGVLSLGVQNEII